MKIRIILTLIFLLTAGVASAQSESTDDKVDKCVSFGDFQTLTVSKENTNSFYLLFSGKANCKKILSKKKIDQAGSDNLVWMMSMQSQDSLNVRQDGAHNLITVFQTQKDDGLKGEMNLIKVNQSGEKNKVQVTQY